MKFKELLSVMTAEDKRTPEEVLEIVLGEDQKAADYLINVIKQILVDTHKRLDSAHLEEWVPFGTHTSKRGYITAGRGLYVNTGVYAIVTVLEESIDIYVPNSTQLMLNAVQNNLCGITGLRGAIYAHEADSEVADKVHTWLQSYCEETDIPITITFEFDDFKYHFVDEHLRSS